MTHSIELEYIKPPNSIEDAPVYKVTGVVNSLNYTPGELLTKEEVEWLCESKASTFTVRII